jgi:hypothetical protein
MRRLAPPSPDLVRPLPAEPARLRSRPARGPGSRPRSGLGHLVRVAACWALASTALGAAETGSLSGRLLHPDRTPAHGITVSATSPALLGVRQTTSRADGSFDLLRLPAGSYVVEAAAAELTARVTAVAVAVDRDTQLTLVLAPATADGAVASVDAAIEVRATTLGVDARSSEVGANFTAEQVATLPLARTYQGLFQLAPGVADNGRPSPNAGGARMDNVYLLDGVTITNPSFGDVLPAVTALDLAEVNVKRAGIAAELGRSSGMVVNAVTRSGGDAFGGRLLVELQPRDFVASSEVASLQNTRERGQLAASLGGPLRRSLAWFYASYGRPEEDLVARRNNLGALPDRETRGDERFLKLTAQPYSQLHLAAGLRRRETDTRGANLGANSHPTLATHDRGVLTLGTFGATLGLGSESFLEARLSYYRDDNRGTPETRFGERPAFDPARPDLVGQFAATVDRLVGGATAPGQTVGGAAFWNRQDFARDEARLVVQSFAATGAVRHDLRAGATWDRAEERLDRRANGWGAITWNAASERFTATFFSPQPPHTGRATATGLFVQDQLVLGERTTLQLGLLANRDVLYGEAPGSRPGTKRRQEILTFAWEDQLQPRLGITLVPSRQGGDRLFLAAGRYYAGENRSLTRAASPTRIFTTRATFDAAGNLLSEIPAANTQSKTVDPDLVPMRTDELTLGYERSFPGAGARATWSGGLWAIAREVDDIYEDVSADGRGNGPFRVTQLPAAYRRYRAATAHLRRTPAPGARWPLWLDASYTWSRLRGNWDVDYADSLFYHSSLLEDGPGVLLGDHRDGLLRGDRTHLAKLFASLRVFDRGRLGAFVRWQSGGAWEARAQPAANVSSSYVRYLEPAGSRRMEDWWNVDLAAAWSLALGGGPGRQPVDVELELRVHNLFDEQVALQVDDRWILDRPFVPGSATNPSLAEPSNNPNFGRPTLLSEPRALLATVSVAF